MKVKVRKYKPDFKKSCETLKKFEKSYYDRTDKKYQKESEEFYKANGFHYEDCWGLDSWFAINMLPRLIQFKENSHGYPGVFYNKYTEEQAKIKWDKILDSMIAAFQIIAEDEFLCFISGNEAFRKGRERIVKNGLKNFIEYYGSLWD